MSKIVEIKNNRPRLYTMNGVTLQPGLNKLPAEQAEKFLEHPHAQIKLERSILEVKGATKPAAKNEDNGGEAGQGGDNQPTAAELIAIIEETEDRELLATAANDGRVTVKRAAEKRIAELDESGQGGDE